MENSKSLLSITEEPAASSSFRSRSFTCLLDDPGASSVVGNLTIMGNKSVMVWFGWGQAQKIDASEKSMQDGEEIIEGTARNRVMGNLVVGMPRSEYQGAFSQDPSSSKLIGTNEAHNDWMASQIAGRLSQAAGVPVFCSCHLHDKLPNILLGGEVEIQLMQSRAVGLVEKEVRRILQQELH